MAHSTLYPAFVKLFYVFSGITHIMNIPCLPSPSPIIIGEEPSVLPKVGAAKTFTMAINELVTYFKPLFHSGTEFSNAEFWYYPTEESDPVWVYTANVAQSGTNPNANVVMSQYVMTFRTGEGGIYKMYLMEPSTTVAMNVRDAYPFNQVSVQALAGWIIGNGGWIVGRDGGYPATGIMLSTKVNDALRKKRLFIGS